MKRLILLLPLLFLLVGCGPTETPSPTAAAVSPIPTPQPDATATAAPVTVTSVKATPAAAPPTPTAPPTQSAPPTPVIDRPGALIRVTMPGQVGVLLDELPLGLRNRVTTAVLNQDDTFWRERAMRQLRFTKLRLNFRDFVYPDKGQLPLPPVRLWQIELDLAGPRRQTIQGHDLILINYTFTTTILSDADSPGQAEPALAEIGGVWEEPFIFPADPDLLLQRTGNACINEGGFPPESYDSENIWHLYDFECEADDGGPLGCHRTTLPTLSCQEALQTAVGQIETTIRFERLPWDDPLADQARIGPVTHRDDPDLQVVGDDLAINRIIYRYVTADDCAIDEGVVGGTGWRRLLQFDATVYNVGGATLHVGPVVAEDNEHNVFEYNGCHDHFHYSHYGNFFLQSGDDLTNSKQAFCVQSTNRLSNNETSPLIHDYTCRLQGIQAGWVDEYIAGLDGQWIDITDLTLPAEGATLELGFTSNGDQFLCEGEPVLDENGAAIWEETGFTNQHGAPISRPVCTFIPDWNNNNEDTRPVFVPQTGSFVTSPCANGEIGPRRNCGFTELNLTAAVPACTPGQLEVVDLALSADAAPQVIRVCERSAALGVGVACPYEDAVANVIVGGEGGTTVSFNCPLIRDDAAAGGGYALYAAPVWPEDGLAEIELP